MRFDADDITTQTPTSIDDVPLQIVNAKNEMTIHNPLQSPIPLLASSYSSIVQRTHANDGERRVYVTFEASNATVVYRLRFRSCTLRSSVCIFVRYVLGAAAAVTSAVADVLLIAVLLCHPALVTSFADLSLGNRSSLIN
ncbi:hypothetical protein OUZ56_001244 [Daphnia magna]|uniref:Uncharacterized protein n=1 Tax=Daphnia magna TaxID=35525 RepID=A0ABR0A226_9CRUS|nr:hypothetical protein OUZ56_001244 [Daphnia magna]